MADEALSLRDRLHSSDLFWVPCPSACTCMLRFREPVSPTTLSQNPNSLPAVGVRLMHVEVPLIRETNDSRVYLHVRPHVERLML